MVRKKCGHQAIEDDPHPYCDICALELRGGLCTETDTCRNCEDALPKTWVTIRLYREKRDLRKTTEHRKQLELLHQLFGHYDNVDQPVIITAQAALDAARALIASSDPPAKSPSSNSSSDSSSLDDLPTTDINTNLDFAFSSDSDLDFVDAAMGSKSKKSSKETKEQKAPSAQSQANAAGFQAMTDSDAAAHMKYLKLQNQQMAAFMSAKTAADVPADNTPAKPASKPAAALMRSPPPVSRSHQLDKPRDSSRKRKSRSISQTKHRKARSPDSTSPKKKQRSPSRNQRSTSRRRKRSASGSGSRKRKNRSASRSHSRGSKRRHTRSDSRQRKVSKRHKRYSYSRSPSSDSSRASSSSSHYSSQRRDKRHSKRDHRRRRSRHSRDRSRDRSKRSRSPRRSLQKQRQQRDNDQRAQRSPQPLADMQHYDQQHDSQQPGQDFTHMKHFDFGQYDDFAPPSDDSDAERPIAEPKSDSFPFREVIELLAKHSDVTLDEPAQARGLKFSMASDDVTGPVTPEFAALTTTQGVRSAISLWESEFFRKNTKRNKPVKARRLFKCDKLRSSLRAYKSGDKHCNMDPLYYQRQPYSWLAQPKTTMEMLTTDVTYMELQMRNILRVANFMEVVNQTINAGYEEKFDEPIMRKLHRCSRHATGDIIKLATNMFCGLATLRKDDILHRSQKIPEKFALLLRHATVGDAQTLLSDETLAEVDAVYTHKLSNTTLERAASSNRGKRGGFQNHQGNYQGGNRGGRGHSNWKQSEFKSQHASGQNSNTR